MEDRNLSYFEPSTSQQLVRVVELLLESYRLVNFGYLELLGNMVM